MVLSKATIEFGFVSGNYMVTLLLTSPIDMRVNRLFEHVGENKLDTELSPPVEMPKTGVHIIRYFPRIHLKMWVAAGDEDVK